MQQTPSPLALNSAPAAQTGRPLLPEDAEWPSADRLVVLVPHNIRDEVGLAMRIYAAAKTRRIGVLYLGLAAAPEDELALRRRLELLAACTRDNHAVRAEYRLAVGSDWPAWLALAWRPGDLVICHAEQRVRGFGVSQPLGHVLAKKLRQPVVMLDGYLQAEPGAGRRGARPLAFWVSALALVIAFLYLQVIIQGAIVGAAQTLLMSLSVAGEFGALAAVNHWLG